MQTNKQANKQQHMCFNICGAKNRLPFYYRTICCDTV